MKITRAWPPDPATPAHDSLPSLSPGRLSPRPGRFIALARQAPKWDWYINFLPSLKDDDIIRVMVLSIPISPDIEAKLKIKAASAGVDIETFAAKTLERVASRPALDELLAPLRAEFESSGMSENELVDLLESAKHEMRAEQRARQSS